ncbi:MAG: M20 family metallopeptidase [Clostridiales bacterium]|nr:M20 family metallopeptidase [Clostridiales bacterium]MDY4060977.1 M20 family metallopeptidase [Anaerovoracaceae bacterium]
MTNQLEKARNLYSYAKGIRERIHKNPELSFKEFETSSLVKHELDNMKIPWTAVGKTGIVGEITGTKSECGKVIAFRADMDALEITETTGAEFASERPGIMHACGHDIHTASLLAIAKILESERNNFSGKIKLIFQPAEELVLGASSMMKENDFIKDVSAVVGYHVMPFLETGTVGLRDGGLMFAGEGFKIFVKGKAGHGAQPKGSIDALLAASAIVLNTQSIISHDTDPRESAVVTICTMKSGTRHNIISDFTEMAGTIRCYTEEKRSELRKDLERIVKNTAEAYGAEGWVEWSMYVPPVYNDKELGKTIRNCCQKVLGEQGVIDCDGLTQSDDFSYYQQKTSGYYILIGCTPANSSYVDIHSPDFLPDDNCIPYITACCVETALALLNNF